MRFFLSAALASSVAAHQMATSISVSGKSFGDGTCVRVPPNTDPLESLADKSIVCNVGGDKAVGRICDVDGASPPPLFLFSMVTNLIGKSWPGNHFYLENLAGREQERSHRRLPQGFLCSLHEESEFFQ